MESKIEYEIVLSDPPYEYDQRCPHSKSRFGGGVSQQYHTQDTNWIANLPVKDLAAKNSLLFQWTTCTHLPDALEIMKAWGFKFSTVAFCWVKNYPEQVMVSVIDPKTGKHLYYAYAVIVEPISVANLDWDQAIDERQPGIFLGTGYYSKSNVELVLLGRRGNSDRLKPVTDRVSNVFITPHPRANNKIIHSAKPVFVHRRINKMYPDLSKIELFARRRYHQGNWHFWGNQVASDIALVDNQWRLINEDVA